MTIEAATRWAGSMVGISLLAIAANGSSGGRAEPHADMSGTAAGISAGEHVHDGVNVDFYNRHGYRFQTGSNGRVESIGVHLNVVETHKSEVLVMLTLHEDNQGRLDSTVVRITTRIPRDRKAIEPTLFALPAGLQLETHTPYWLVIDSPSGTPIRWANGTGRSEHYARNMLSAQEQYGTAARGAFAVHYLEAPAQTAARRAGSTSPDGH